MHKPTPESVAASIKSIQYHRWEGTAFTSCLIERDDGLLVDGYSCPIDAGDYDQALGEQAAYKRAFEKLFNHAVSSCFERRAMLAGARDVLDRCGVGSEDLGGPSVITVSPAATQEQRDEIQQLLGVHLVGKVQPAGPLEYPERQYFQVRDRMLTVSAQFGQKPASVIAPAIGSVVIVRICSSFHFPEGAEIIGIVARDTGTGEPSAIEVAIAFAPGRYLTSSVYASAWSQLELVDRPLTVEEAGHVAALRKRLGADHAHA